ncbi:CAP domain-containing protein [Spirochaeta dissipatitropha]
MNNNIISRVLAGAFVLILLGFFTGCEALLGDLMNDETRSEVTTEDVIEDVTEDTTDETTEGTTEDVTEETTEDETEDEPQGMVEELLYAVNNYREENSLPPLEFHESLEDAAQNHTDYMVEIQAITYDSQYSDGLFLQDLGTEYGISYSYAVGETGHGFNDNFPFFDITVDYMSNDYLRPDATHHAAAKAYGARELENGGYSYGYYMTYIQIDATEDSEED